MSSILKALKKLEDEQTGRAATSPSGSGGQFVAPARVGRPLLLLTCGIGAGLLLAGGLYFLFGGRREIPAPFSPVALEQKLAGLPDTAVPGASPVIAEPAPARPMTAPVPPASPVAVSPVKVSVAAAQRAEKKDATIAPEVKIKAEIAPPEPSVLPKVAAEPLKVPVEQVQVERHDIPAPGQQWTAPQLTVSDILPASGGGRMAIVNGLPVMEGTMVEDAVVREIRPDQVVFEVEGKSVAVPLSSSR